MKKKYLIIATAISCFALAFSACANNDNVENETTIQAESITSNSDSVDKVATGDETVEAVEVVSPDMVPVYADALKDGTYDIKVDSSSSMFNISSCKLIVAGGEMKATMTMGGTGYKYLFMGTPDEAVNADEKDYIPYEENENGENEFTVPVEALDAGVDCAAFSKKKEKWYDRVLVFRADSLPSDAYSDGVFTTVESLNLADGTYTIDVTLEGGSGKAKVDSPANIKVESGKATATITWSSEHYDYMKVDDVRYDRINTEGNSVFEIPVKGFDYKMAVIGDTTAMSEPHEIEYTLYFDSSSIK